MVSYELDTTVPVAVAAYLDAEHYAYLHNNYSPTYEVLDYEDCKCRIRQSWRLGPYRVGQTCTTEYIPPARFLNYDVMPDPWWFPNIHHFIDVVTDLRYSPTDDGQSTVSDLHVSVRMPFWLWPLRHRLRRKIETLKRQKDREDMEMIHRRARLFGRGNIKAFLSDHQFLLYKDYFVKNFGA